MRMCVCTGACVQVCLRVWFVRVVVGVCVCVCAPAFACLRLWVAEFASAPPPVGIVLLLLLVSVLVEFVSIGRGVRGALVSVDVVCVRIVCVM